jgi:hypothetical protein
MTSLATIAGLLLVFRAHKTSVGEVQVDEVDEMEIKRLEVELRARLRISMWKTSRASHSSITRRPLLAEADLPGQGVISGVTHLMLEVIKEEEGDGVASTLEEVVSVAEGEDGGIGKRFVLCCFITAVRAQVAGSHYFQNNRTRESSVAISPQWSMLEEIEFHRLAKLRLEVDEPEEL